MSLNALFSGMASASETIGFDCGAARLEFSRADGRVMGLYRGGTNLLAPSDKAFEIRMLDDSGGVFDPGQFGFWEVSHARKDPSMVRMR